MQENSLKALPGIVGVNCFRTLSHSPKFVETGNLLQDFVT
jgi:hypothetical protein